VIEELETSNEELQSTNEELMSTNEELQSTNEELHSVNEELYTVSQEHKRDNDELSIKNDEINLLFSASKIGLVYLDTRLNVTRYTENAGKFFQLTANSIGHRLFYSAPRFRNSEILDLIDLVNENWISAETEVAVGDEVFLARLIPNFSESRENYRGIVILVVDITELSNVKLQLDRMSKLYGDIVEGTSCIVARWNAKTNTTVYCNEAYASRWNTTPSELIGKDISSLSSSKDRIKFFESLQDLKIGQSVTHFLSITIEKNGTRSQRPLLISTKALSKNGIAVDEYQSIGVECSENVKFLEQLAANSTDGMPAGEKPVAET